MVERVELHPRAVGVGRGDPLSTVCDGRVDVHAERGLVGLADEGVQWSGVASVQVVVVAQADTVEHDGHRPAELQPGGLLGGHVHHTDGVRTAVDALVDQDLAQVADVLRLHELVAGTGCLGGCLSGRRNCDHSCESERHDADAHDNTLEHYNHPVRTSKSSRNLRVTHIIQ